MFLRLSYILIFCSCCFFTTIYSCSITCLNQTSRALPPPIFINDSLTDIQIVFKISCEDQNITLSYVNVTLSVSNEKTLELKSPKEFELDFTTIHTQNGTFNVTVHGLLLGYSRLYIHAIYLDSNHSILENITTDYDVDFAVKRKQTVLDTIFTVVIIILLAYGLAKATKLSSSTALGLLATGASPGGGASNITIAAFATFPLWILLLGRDFINVHAVHFPWENMFSTLFALIVPASIGLALRYFKPTIADRLTRLLRYVTIFFILYILTFGIYTNLYIFKLINYRIIITSALLPWTGFFIGVVFSLVTCQTRERLISIFIESGLQNTGVAIFFLRLSLPQPDSDLAIIVPIFVALAIPIPLLIIYAIVSAYRYYHKRKAGLTIVAINTPDATQYERLPNSDDEP
ncbi:unnamed protein product [Didymodactylos carnosus]|uniref:Uncharacterized protein n=1 Tax=Didymodactylos carnosus TaxID=1234261 RepID=A0A813P5J4_9BILA|nr:unnamed protein product [Didymodactylos carnosus]CAF3528593.1 unnamed protein product [Didymodactylos carnosus]